MDGGEKTFFSFYSGRSEEVCEKFCLSFYSISSQTGTFPRECTDMQTTKLYRAGEMVLKPTSCQSYLRYTNITRDLVKYISRGLEERDGNKKYKRGNKKMKNTE